MSTYQEQLAKLRRQREGRESTETFFERLADGLMPLIDDGTITMDVAAKVMVAVTKAITKYAESIRNAE